MAIRTKKEFVRPFTKAEAIEYLRHTFSDGDIKSVHITWRFDEQQADPFHHFWSGGDFIKAVKAIIAE